MSNLVKVYPIRERERKLEDLKVQLTDPQKRLLEELLIDLQLWTPSTVKLGYLSRVTQRDIKFLDEVTKAEASLLIGQLLARRTRETKARSMEGEKGLFDDSE